MAPLAGDSGIRKRNFSQLCGYSLYQYEYHYNGPLHDDIVTSVTVHLNVMSNTIDSFRRYRPTLFRRVPPDATFEIYSLLMIYFNLSDLQRSVFVRFEDRDEDFVSSFEQTDLVSCLLKELKSSDFALESFYADFTHSLIDDQYDHFDFHLVLA